MKKLLLPFLVLGMVSALSTTPLSAAVKTEKTVNVYGYKTFEIEASMQAAAVTTSNFFSVEKVLMKSLKARTTFVDTVVNATPKTQYGIFGFDAKKLTVQADLNKVSGTVAGKVILEGSVDGLRFERIAKTDSLLLTNVAYQYKIFKPTGLDLNYVYFQIRVVPSGTQVVKLTSFGYIER